MQTDCPKEDMRDSKMNRNNNGRMRRMKVSGKIRLRKKKLPHTRDPEFATPESQGKQAGTYEDREEERTQHKQKQVKHKQRFGEREMRSRRSLRLRCTCSNPGRRGWWGGCRCLLTISCCSCIWAIFLVYFWSTCFSSATTPSQRSLRAFLSLMSCTDTQPHPV